MGIELFRSLLASIIHKHFCCNRPTLRVETQTIRCCDKPADSPLAPWASLGVEPERGRRLDSARDPELVEGATNRHE